MRLVNTAIMANPVNWIKVPLMAVFGMVALYMLSRLFANPPVVVEND